MGLLSKIHLLPSFHKIATGSFGSLAKVKRIYDLDKYFSNYNAKSLNLTNSTSLDLGCGTIPKNPFEANILFGIDIRKNSEKNIKNCDLTTEPIPFENNYFNYITAFDFLEHIPRIIYNPNRRFPFIELMNEVWRTLKLNGIFLSVTPVYPLTSAFQDPTHVNIITSETFTIYFDDYEKGGSMYGFKGAFKILDQSLSNVHLISLLQKKDV